MNEKLVIPPVPESRADRYDWIDAVSTIGISIKRACEMADVPLVSYYKLHRYKKKAPAPNSQGPTDHAHEDSCDCGAATGANHTRPPRPQEDKE